MKIAKPHLPPVSHDRLVLISSEKQRCSVIKHRKRELFVNLFSCFVSSFIFSLAEARHLDNDNVCCFFSLRVVYELS